MCVSLSHHTMSHAGAATNKKRRPGQLKRVRDREREICNCPRESSVTRCERRNCMEHRPIYICRHAHRASRGPRYNDMSSLIRKDWQTQCRWTSTVNWRRFNSNTMITSRSLLIWNQCWPNDSALHVPNNFQSIESSAAVGLFNKLTVGAHSRLHGPCQKIKIICWIFRKARRAWSGCADAIMAPKVETVGIRLLMASEGDFLVSADLLQGLVVPSGDEKQRPWSGVN